MQIIRNLSISTKFTLIALLFSLLFFCSTILITKFATESIIENKYQQEIKEKSEIFNTLISDKAKSALTMTEWFEGSARLISAIKSNNRETVMQIGQLAMRAMNLDFLVVTDSSGNVVIRAHEPEKFGDSIYYQKVVQKALTGEKIVGIEQGTVVKFSIRAATPIIDTDGKVIGSIILGYVLSNNEFLDKQKNILNCDFTIFSNDERIATTLVENGKRITGTKLEHSDILKTVLKDRKSYYNKTTILNNPYLAAYTPIIDINNNAAGIIFTGINVKIAETITNNIILYVSVGLLLIILLMIIGFIILGKQVIELKIKLMLNFLINFSKGDLRGRLEITNQDELGVFAQGINNMADNLEKIITDITDNISILNQSVQNIASSNESLSQRTSEQASSIEEIASTIEQTAASINHNADNSEQARNMSETTIANAKETEQVLSQAVDAITEISLSSKKIGEITSLINEISFQTNLLALNAAVEAARAGETGRGFAVVAGEVRNLAQRSGNAAKEIEKLIKETNRKIENGVDLTAKTNESIKLVASSITNLNKIIIEVAASNQEQKQGIAQINIAVTEMDKITQQNAAHVEETASSSEEMAKISQDVIEIVQFFKVNEKKTDKYKSEKIRIS